MATVLQNENVNEVVEADAAENAGALHESRGRGRPRGRGGGGRGRGGRGRGRGSRGRGRGGRGRARRAVFKYEDPSKGWRLRTPDQESIVLESDFSSDLTMERVRLFCVSALNSLDDELRAKGLAESRVSYVVLMLEDVLEQCRKWLNGHISLHDLGRKAVGMDDMYRYVAVMLASHLYGISLDRTLDTLSRFDCTPPPLDRVRFISTNILAYPATGRRNAGGGVVWNAQRDPTQLLDTFEKTAYAMSRGVFLTPVHTMVTLDDDLHGTRSKLNPVKTLSSRKADREGHAADTICDAFFRITLGARLRRRGEAQAINVEKLLDAVTEGRGEESLHGMVVTADRGYGGMQLIRLLLRYGIGSILVMPEHLLRCHPFVGKSYFTVTRDDQNQDEPLDEAQNSDSDMDGDENTGGDALLANAHSGDGDAADSELADIMSSRQDNVRAAAQGEVFDRRAAFVVDDDPDAGFASFFAQKSAKPLGARPLRKSQVSAIAVREKGNEHFSKVLRFMYTVPTSLARSIETWIAVPKGEFLHHGILFSERVKEGGPLVASDENGSGKGTIESMVLGSCIVLTISQRCADWFTMRQYRVTATMAGKIILRDERVLELLGYTTPHSSPETDLSETMKALVDAWFSSSRSTEPMMRGSANEGAVIAALSKKPFVRAIYECGMFARADDEWVACSPDALALVDTNSLGLSDSDTPELASVEIKTSIASSSLDRALRVASVDVKTCIVGDAAFRSLVPREHTGQILHQMVVLSVRLVVYVSAAEVGVLYIVVIKSPQNILDQCLLVLKERAETCVSWAYKDDPRIPTFADPRSRRVMKDRLSFWLTVNRHVWQNGPFPPLKIFKHGAQSLYSKTKGGVDGATQFRAVLRSPTSSLAWEQKIVLQTLKTLVVNAFLAWRMSQRRDLLKSSDVFRGVEQFRSALNNVQSYGDFVHDLAPELLRYAEGLGPVSENELEQVSLGDPEGVRLSDLAKRRPGRRVNFFNTSEGVRLRLNVHPHTQRHLPGTFKYCALCGSGEKRRRSCFKCGTCHTHLCVRALPNQRKSCWALWHEAKRLEPNRASAPESRNGIQREGRKVRTETFVPRQQPATKRRRSSRDGVPTPPALHIPSAAGRPAQVGASATKRRRRSADGGATNSSSQAARSGLVCCASECGRDPHLPPTGSAHVCETCGKPMHGFCVYALGGALGGEEYEGFGKGGFCKPCSLKTA